MGGNVVGNELKFLKKILIKSDFYQKFSFLRGDQGYHTGTSTLPGKTKISGRKGQIWASTFEYMTIDY